MKNNKKLDFLVFVLLVVIMALAWWYFGLKPLYGFLLYTLIPSVYLSLRKKKNLLKISLAVFTLGTLFGFLFDTIQVINNAWVVDLVLPWKILGIAPVDNILGYTLMTLLIVVFYEHFLDDENNKRLSKRFARFFLILSIVMIIFYILLANSPDLFKISYSYVTLALIAIITPILLILRRPKFITKMLVMSAVFFGVWFLNVIVVLKTGGWAYFGEFVGWVTVFGVTFPFEELFFWMMWYAVTVVAFYELFIDDLR